MTTDKTWIKLKTHLKTDHSKLKSVLGNNTQSTTFHKANYMADQVLQKVQNGQHLVSWAFGSISTNQTDQDNVPPLAPLVDPVVNATSCVNDTILL